MTDNNQILLDHYLSGEMTEEEQSHFENRLRTDYSLRAKFDAYAATLDSIDDLGRLELQETLETFESSLDKKSIIPLWIKRALPIAAMLVVFFSVYQLLQSGKEINGAEAFDNYFELYDSPSNYRSGPEDSQVNFIEASEAYDQGNFEKAIQHLDLATNEVPEYLIKFYLGLSNMAKTSANLTEAVANFDRVIEGDNDYVQQAKWYKSLALLKLDEEDLARDMLNQIVIEKSYHHKQAKELLGRLTQN